MACITFTRTSIPLTRGASPAPGWSVSYEGQLVATYAEKADGRLVQVGSTGLDRPLGACAGPRGGPAEFPSYDDLRETYIRNAKTWEAWKAREGKPVGRTARQI